jgi:hypothetical protein
MVILAAFLCPACAFAVEYTADLTWNKMMGTEHYKVYSTDTYSSGKKTGSLIRLDLVNDKGGIKRSDIINTRRNFIWQLFNAEKIGARYEYYNEPKIMVAADWAKDPQTTFLRDEVCNGVKCRVYHWVSNDSKFFKIEYYYWISKDNIIIKQEDTKLGKVLQEINDLKQYGEGTLKAELFKVPDDYEVVKVQ